MKAFEPGDVVDRSGRFPGDDPWRSLIGPKQWAADRITYQIGATVDHEDYLFDEFGLSPGNGIAPDAGAGIPLRLDGTRDASVLPERAGNWPDPPSGRIEVSFAQSVREILSHVSRTIGLTIDEEAVDQADAQLQIYGAYGILEIPADVNEIFRRALKGESLAPADRETLYRFSQSAEYQAGLAFPPGVDEGVEHAFEAFAFIELTDRTRSVAPGSEVYWIALHELMHTLGLDHPHTTEGDTTDTFVKGRHVTASYVPGNGAAEPLEAGKIYGNPVTPMAADYAALHAMYGARAAFEGDTVYSLVHGSKTSPDRNFDLRANEVEVGRAHYAIWDTGGVDTLRYRGGKDVVLDLRPADFTGPGLGATGIFDDQVPFSFIGTADSARMRGSFSIAGSARGSPLETIIENAVGGRGDDLIRGNAAANVLKGGGGADWIEGGGAADRILGQAGADTLVYAPGADLLGGAHDDEIVVPVGVVPRDEVDGGPGRDRLVVEVRPGDQVDLTGLATRQIEAVEIRAHPGAAGPFDVWMTVDPTWLDARLTWIGAESEGITTHLTAVPSITGADLSEWRFRDWAAPVAVLGDDRDTWLNGGPGRESMVGGYGIDTLVGGAGDDTLLSRPAHGDGDVPDSADQARRRHHFRRGGWRCHRRRRRAGPAVR